MYERERVSLLDLVDALLEPEHGEDDVAEAAGGADVVHAPHHQVHLGADHGPCWNADLLEGV